ncbi:MAG: hypothetical protein LQ350_004116 [Teloschistes chrysophthalmus]|nr:MAG: hypothetical protein LQ350_004116 [Niorma chrysophthalma]
MAIRIFIKFRTDQVPGPSAEKDLVVAKAACSKLLDREFGFAKDFIHSQEEIFQEEARCHVLVDCDYHDAPKLDAKDAVLHFYQVVVDEEATFWMSSVEYELM